jgi:hypothetical protein
MLERLDRRLLAEASIGDGNSRDLDFDRNSSVAYGTFCVERVMKEKEEESNVVGKVNELTVKALNGNGLRKFGTTSKWWGGGSSREIVEGVASGKRRRRMWPVLKAMIWIGLTTAANRRRRRPILKAILEEEGKQVSRSQRDSRSRIHRPE